ncbi:hypothetical protein WICANDRAFT_82883 [Wickerhamomyces anomalus NRRL Y-366-8]|uniref:Uncharacterized protein n=1 Tax=Wickerhamomyces anomalus (strain ATCC 58044 / CBS 1984 / NCYC 433 / NRRL Y-366-8) TaxID=683960 RepID=A0A1E3PCR1_WICAA|nr:uncharacterized protein WICANDRAFT_82883 [Wickerhamomyces anomalus NRRL Y-366-8]ODQ62994.1 hypothetical protein WICANDRAFT_82883 [Wickerhamomyces anomalus NRRL Y-366-8]
MAPFLPPEMHDFVKKVPGLRTSTSSKVCWKAIGYTSYNSILTNEHCTPVIEPYFVIIWKFSSTKSSLILQILMTKRILAIEHPVDALVIDA